MLQQGGDFFIRNAYNQYPYQLLLEKILNSDSSSEDLPALKELLKAVNQKFKDIALDSEPQSQSQICIASNSTAVESASFEELEFFLGTDEQSDERKDKTFATRVLDNEGNTPLHLAAAKMDDPKIAEILIKHGARVNASNSKGQKPIHIAANRTDNNGAKCLELLIKNGAKLNLGNSKGMKPIHIAAESGNIKTLQLLIDNGAKVNCKDGPGRTPLHYAAKKTV